MSAAQREHANQLAKTNPTQALAHAQRIADPWYRAQALSWVARFTDADPKPIVRQAANAAAECSDTFKRSSVRAWEVAALAQRGLLAESRAALAEAFKLAASVEPIASRSEAFFLLMQAACSIDPVTAAKVHTQLATSCAADAHWRTQRNLRDATRLAKGETSPRLFFW
jgi:hypothetical protein